MNIHIMHDAATLAAISGAASPSCESIIIRRGDASAVLASSHAGNPLAHYWLFDIESPGQFVLAWSGTPSDDLFERDPRAWTKPGRDAFARFCDEVVPQLTRHQRSLCFRPHARHVLNDAPSCLTFLRERAGQPFAIALDPVAMLEPSMVDRVDEHLERQFESLGPRCAMVILSDVQVAKAEEDDSRCEPIALGSGLLPRDRVLALLREHVPDATPIVIDGRQGGKAIREQLAWLGD